MKISKMLSGALVATMMLTIGATAFAAPKTQNLSTDLADTEIVVGQNVDNAVKGVPLEKSTAAVDWSALTDAQKQEIYAINDKTFAAQLEIIDKYLEYGIIDAETAQQMKDSIAQCQSDMKANDRPVGMGRGRGGMGKGKGGGCINNGDCPLTPNQPATNTTEQ